MKPYIATRIGLITFAVVVSWIPTRAAAEGRSDVLALHAQSSTPCTSDPAAFRLTLTFENRGDTPILILPSRIRRHYRGYEASAAATYIPYPGPPISPWRGTFSIAPGASHTIELSGMQDGDGAWRLEAGQYSLRIGYAVEPALESAQTDVESLSPELRNTPLWVGELQTEAIPVVHAPETRADHIDFAWPEPCIRKTLFRVIGALQRVPDAQRVLESRGFECSFDEDGFPKTIAAPAGGRHLYCKWSRGARVVYTWYVVVLAAGREIHGLVALPERIHM